MSTLPTESWTITQALQYARALGVDRLDAQLLVCEAVQQSRTWLLAHDCDLLAPNQQTWLSDRLQRRAQGEPLAYILGRKEFFGLDLQVSPDVLVPRPDTETLVEWALDVLSHLPANRSLRVLDLGTGSGAIALAIQHRLREAHVTAVDASEAALRVAQANAQRLGLPVRFLHGSWLTPVADEQFDLIVSNPPYIEDADPHLADLSHEPAEALTSGTDGLDDIRQIVANAPRHLRPGGWLLLEHGYNQSVAVAQLIRAQGLNNVSTRFDLAGHGRCTGGQMAVPLPNRDQG